MRSRRSLLATIGLVFVACTCVLGGVARADGIRHPAGFAFDLPDIGKAWEQEPHGDLVIVSDETDTLPEIQIFVFPARTEGGLAEIEGRLAAELARPGVSLAGDPVKTVKLGQATTETIAGASVRLGTAMLNRGDQAMFAIVQRKGRSLILVGVPKPGIFERGASNFRAVVRGLQAARGDTAGAPARPPAAGGAATPSAAGGAATPELPKLPRLVAIREVTASSTFVDKARRDAYAAWRVLEYSQELDESTRTYVPSTAWCEGKPDEGVGEGVAIALAAPTQIDAIRIAAGVWKSAKLHAANNQIAALEVSLDGKPTRVSPAATRTWLEVPVGRTVSTIAIKLAEVKKAKMNDSCLSGVELVQHHEVLQPARNLEGAAAAELPRALAALQSSLLAPGRPGLEKLLEFPFVNHDASGFFAAGAPGPIKHASWKALDAACRAWDKLVERDAIDESRPVSCQRPADVDPADDRPARVINAGPGKIEVVFPGHREVNELWRLHWRDGAWRLTAIDYR
jgi:hypothetical protein